jgi:hypothetical protein
MFSAAKAAETSACRGDTRIESTVVRNASVVLVKRVVAKSVETILGASHCGEWVAIAMLLANTAQNKAKSKLSPETPNTRDMQLLLLECG